MTAWGFDSCTHEQRSQSVFWQKKVNAAAPRNKPGKFMMWYDPSSEASFAMDQTGVALSHLEANHMVMCLHRMIVTEGIEWVDFMKFEGCNAPGESQEQATVWLQNQL